MIVSNFYYLGCDPSQYVGVPQHGYAVESATHKSILFTCHVRTCVAVTIYSPAEKIGFLAHFDTCTDFAATIEKIAKKINEIGLKSESLDVKMIGGFKYEEEDFIIAPLELELKKHFKKYDKLTGLKGELTQKESDLISDHYEDFKHLRNLQLHKAGFNKNKIDDLKLAERLESILSHTCYMQVSLNLESGEVRETSKLSYYLDIKEQLEGNAFSKKAQKMAQYIFKLTNRICRNEMSENEVKVWPLKKIYDGVTISS